MALGVDGDDDPVRAAAADVVEECVVERRAHTCRPGVILDQQPVAVEHELVRDGEIVAAREHDRVVLGDERVRGRRE